MNWLQEIEQAFVTTESMIQGWIVDIINGAEVAATDLEKALNFVASKAPAIAAGIASVEAMVAEIAAVNPGLVQNAVVTQAIKDANASVAGLNAFANLANAGGATPASVVAGYVAYQQSMASASGAMAAVASLGAAAH